MQLNIVFNLYIYLIIFHSDPLRIIKFLYLYHGLCLFPDEKRNAR